MLHKVILMVVILLLSNVVFAASDPLIERCNVDYEKCIIDVNHKLQVISEKSFTWYSYKLLELEALFRLTKYSELNKKATEVLSFESVPQKLQLRAYIYKAKIAHFNQNINDKKNYARKAKNLLAQLADNSEDPYIIIEYANFQIYLKDYDEGIRLLTELESKFKGSANNLVNYKINMNIGHMYLNKKNFKQANTYYSAALKNAKQLPNTLPLVIMEYNVALVNQKLNNLDIALIHFQNSLDANEGSLNQNTKSKARLRIAEILIQQGKPKNALSYLEQVDIKVLSLGDQTYVQGLLKNHGSSTLD